MCVCVSVCLALTCALSARICTISSGVYGNVRMMTNRSNRSTGSPWGLIMSVPRIYDTHTHTHMHTHTLLTHCCVRCLVPCKADRNQAFAASLQRLGRALTCAYVCVSYSTHCTDASVGGEDDNGRQTAL